MELTGLGDVFLGGFEGFLEFFVTDTFVSVGLGYFYYLNFQFLHPHLCYLLRNNTRHLNLLLLRQPLPQQPILRLQHLYLPPQINNLSPRQLQRLSFIINFLNHTMNHLLLLSELLT